MNKKANNYINLQLKNFNVIINNIISEIKKNNQQLSQLLNNYNGNNENDKKLSIIEGELDIKLNDIKKGILLFNTNFKDKIDVYLEDKVINLIKENDKHIIDSIYFKRDGKHKFKIIFTNNLDTLEYLFMNLYSIDLSN